MKENTLDQRTIRADGMRPAKGGGYLLSGSVVTVALPSAPRRYLYHGWQSWSLAAWVDCDRPPLATMRPYSLHPMQSDPAHARDAQPNGSWYGAVELENGQIVFLGALGLDSHVALRNDTLEGWYEDTGAPANSPHGWFVSSGDESEVMARYAELLGVQFDKPRLAAPRVWCSWYSLYTEISEPALLKILGDLGDPRDPQGLPFDVFQVDDGWQVGIGDWVPNEKFPAGMNGLAARIRETGRTPGLWLAPLLVVPSSSLYRQHRDWLLRDEEGRLVPAGFNWNEPLFALDTTHPEALAWLTGLMQQVRAWGYDYVKLDFLYAGALPGKRHVEMPREAAYRQGLKAVRGALGKAFFLTCGAPILPSLGLCDGMRVGPDVAGDWESPRDSRLLQNFTTPGTRNAIRTTLNRLWLQPLVHTDPDVVYFRSMQNKLTQEQMALLQDLGLVAGFKATSDVPAWLKGAERAALRAYLENQPPVAVIGRYKYRIGKREVDFSSAAELLPVPPRLANAWGAILGALADVPALMRIFDRLTRKTLKKNIEKNKV